MGPASESPNSWYALRRRTRPWGGQQELKTAINQGHSTHKVNEKADQTEPSPGEESGNESPSTWVQAGLRSAKAEGGLCSHRLGIRGGHWPSFTLICDHKQYAWCLPTPQRLHAAGTPVDSDSPDRGSGSRGLRTEMLCVSMRFCSLTPPLSQLSHSKLLRFMSHLLQTSLN